MSKALLIFIFIFSIAFAIEVCELELRVGPPTDPKALVHTKAATIDDYTDEQVEELIKEAIQARTSPLKNGHQKELKAELEYQLNNLQGLSDAQKLELVTANALVRDAKIGSQVRGYNVQILDPTPWEYFPLNRYPEEFKHFAEDGHVIRSFYEVDVELICCIVEISFSNHFEGILNKKKRQLERMVNKNGRTDFINPDGKKVILYTPNAKIGDVSALEAIGADHAGSIGELKSKIKRVMSKAK